MTFDEWYTEFIVRGQPWGKDGDYRQSQQYLNYKRVWETGYEEGHCKGYQEGLKDDPF